MNLTDDFTTQISEKIKRFRLDDLFLAIYEDNSGKPRIIIKNVKTNYHVDIFEKKAGKLGTIITDEKSRGKNTEHQFKDSFLKLQQYIKKKCIDLFEYVPSDDPKYTGKLVRLISNHYISNVEVKNSKAYIKSGFLEEQRYFDFINPFESQLGIVQDEDGYETDVLIIGNGEIYRINLLFFKKFEKKVNQKFPWVGMITA